MRIQRNHCTCGKKQEPFELKDEFNSIACRICFEILSWERIEKTKFGKINHLNPTLEDFVQVLDEIRA